MNSRIIKGIFIILFFAVSTASTCHARLAFNPNNSSIEWYPMDKWVGLSVSKYSGKTMLLPAPLDAEKGSILFKLPDGTTEWLVEHKHDNAFPVDNCLTNKGHKVRVAIQSGGARPKVTITPIDWKADSITLVWKADNDEDFFGGGEVWNGSVNQRGKSIKMYVNNGTPDRCCYTPFYFSSKGYGLYVDTTESGTMSFSTPEAPDKVVLSFNTKDRQGLTFYYLAGPTPKDVIQNYTQTTGRPPLPPKWNFLPWKWRDEHKNWGEVFEDANGMRNNDIPCSILWIDNPWQKYGLCSFEFDPQRFPDAENRIKDLKKMGYKVVVWVAPFTNPSIPNYQVALDKGYFVKNPNGLPYKMGGGYYIDLTNPAAYNWWKEEMKKVIRIGIDGFKLDRGQDIADNAVFSDGSTGASMHNGYALLYTKVCYDALHEVLGDNFTLLPRPGCAGSQQYSPGKWPGDLGTDYSVKSGLGSAIPAGLNIGLSGFAFWGSDIGGFEGSGPDLRLLARWSQFGCFSPIMELGGISVHEPWNPKYGKQGVPIYRYYATLHSELLPYTYNYAIEAHETGVPIMRPLVLEFPNDANARNESFEFTYGENILVAPIYTEQDTRDIYLPSGEWVDYWNWKKVHKGATRLTGAQYPMERAPIFFKNGSIIPMEVENDYTGHGSKYSKGKLTLLAFPKGNSSFLMKDTSSSSSFQMGTLPDAVLVSWKNTSKPLLLRVRMDKAVRVVSEGKAYTRCDTKAYVGKPGTWCFDPAAACVMVSPMQGVGVVSIGW